MVLTAGGPRLRLLADGPSQNAATGSRRESVRVFEIATRHHGQSGRMSFLDKRCTLASKNCAICGQMVRLFWTTICIFWTAIYGFVLWDRN
jgi:hypothetical protein